MGSAAAWALASRGRAVTLLEQFSPGHRNGASHGATRNLNPGYADPDYVAMPAEAVRLWDELEADGGERLLARAGVVNHGTDPRLGEVRTALHRAPPAQRPRRRSSRRPARGSADTATPIPGPGTGAMWL